MKKLNWKNITIILGILSILYIVLLKTIDVRPIGPYHTKVGFATINNFVHVYLPKNTPWYKITKYLGYLTFIIVVYYAWIGLSQLIKYKSIKKVDKKIILLGLFYILVGIVYVFFEKVIINYRPLLMNKELEASFPSSHTMLALCVCGSSLIMSKYRIKDKKKKKHIGYDYLVINDRISCWKSFIRSSLVNRYNWFCNNISLPVIIITNIFKKNKEIKRSI